MSRKNYLIMAAVAVALLVAFWASGSLLMFFNPLGLLLVLGGTLSAAWVAFPRTTLLGLWEQMSGLRQAKVLSARQLVELFYQLGRLRRFRGVRHMEELAEGNDNQFLRMAVAMVADERPAVDIAQRLEQEMDFFLARRESQRAVLSFMGRLAPAFGLAGTMIGLIRMLHTLSDPTAVASGMSVALLTTFYGLMIANLVVLPLERKLKEHNRAEAVEMALITEGAVALAQETNASAVAARLASFRYAEEAQAAGPRLNIKGALESLRAVAAGLRKVSDER
ncbi:motility protein A [Desulfarculus baarsii]